MRWSGGGWVTDAQIQWAPTLTFHDPNPPFPLESAAGPAIVEGSVAFSGAGALVSAAILQVLGQTSQIGLGALNSTGLVQVLASGLFSAQGSLVATGEVIGQESGGTPGRMMMGLI